AVGDVDGDGHPDVVVNTTSMVSVLFGTGNGTFGAGASYVSPWNNFPVIRLGDLNGDGRLDVAMTDVEDHSIGGAGLRGACVPWRGPNGQMYVNPPQGHLSYQLTSPRPSCDLLYCEGAARSSSP